MVLSRLDHGARRMNWVHINCCMLLLYCGSIWWVCGWHGEVRGCVGGRIGWYVVDCVIL